MDLVPKASVCSRSNDTNNVPLVSIRKLYVGGIKQNVSNLFQVKYSFYKGILMYLMQIKIRQLILIVEHFLCSDKDFDIKS